MLNTKHTYLTERAREVVIATDLSAAGVTHALQLIPTGTGVIDLERAALAGLDENTQGSDDGSAALYITSALWAGEERLVRAAGDPSANPWDPSRGDVRRVPYGLRQISGNNSLAIEAETNGQAFAASLAVPAFRGGVCDEGPKPDAPAFLLGVDAANIAATQIANGNTGTFGIEAVSDCVVDLDTLIIEATRTNYSGTEPINPDLTKGCTVSAIVLPDGTPLVVPAFGVSAPEAPAGLWCPCRPKNWVRFGWVRMSSGDAITVKVVNRSGFAATIVPSVVAYEVGGGCKPKPTLPLIRPC